MTKQNKMLLGVGAIAIATYLVFKNKKKSFANFTSKTYTVKCGDGTTYNYVRVPEIYGVTTTKLNDAQMILQTFTSCETKGKISYIN